MEGAGALEDVCVYGVEESNYGWTFVTTWVKSVVYRGRTLTIKILLSGKIKFPKM